MPIEIVMIFCVAVLGSILAVIIMIRPIKAKMVEIKARPDRPVITARKRLRLAGQGALVASGFLAFAVGLDLVLKREDLGAVQYGLTLATHYALTGIGSVMVALAFLHLLASKWARQDENRDAIAKREREACVEAIRAIGEARGIQTCCGVGLYGAAGGPPECCNKPKLMIDADEAIDAILARGAPAHGPTPATGA